MTQERVLKSFVDFSVKKKYIFEADKAPSDIIENLPWYYVKFKYDPTIKSMLAMLDRIHFQYKKCQEILKKNKLDNKVDVDVLNKVLKFNVLDMNEFDLGEELYVIMNDRGKPLTAYENFKSSLLDWMQHNDDEAIRIYFCGEVEENKDSKPRWLKFSENLDNIWTEKLWMENKNSEKTDEIMYKFFCRYISVLFIGLGEEVSKDKDLMDAFECLFNEKIENYDFNNFKIILDELVDDDKKADEFLTNLNNYMEYLFGENDLNYFLTPSWSRTIITRQCELEGLKKDVQYKLYGKIKDKDGKVLSCVESEEFVSGKQKKTITIKYSPIKTSDCYGKVLDFTENIANATIKNVETEYDVDERCKDILFVSNEKNKEYDNVSWAINYALQLYIEKIGKNAKQQEKIKIQDSQEQLTPAKETKVDINSESFKQWKRFAWNVVEEIDANRAKEQAIGAIKIFSNLKDSVDDIVHALASKEDDERESVRLEIRKAKYLIKNSEKENWYGEIIKAEAHPYLKGYIDMLVEDPNTDTLEGFEKRLNNLNHIFSNEGFKTDNNHLVIRALLSGLDLSVQNQNAKKKEKEIIVSDTEKSSKTLKNQMKKYWIDSIKKYLNMDDADAMKKAMEDDCSSQKQTNQNLDLKGWLDVICNDSQFMNWLQKQNKKVIKIKEFRDKSVRLVLGPTESYPQIWMDKEAYKWIEKITEKGFKLPELFESCDLKVDDTTIKVYEGYSKLALQKDFAKQSVGGSKKIATLTVTITVSIDGKIQIGNFKTIEKKESETSEEYATKVSDVLDKWIKDQELIEVS